MITYREINFRNINDCTILSEFVKNIDIQHLSYPNFNECPFVEFEPNQILGTNDPNHHCFFILSNDTPIGDFSICLNFPLLFNKKANRAWISISINNKNYRGIGIGKIVFDHIIHKCKQLGVTSIELGVFEFNKIAIAFYEKLGFERIGVVPNFTYYNESWHDDYRYELKLYKK